MARVYGTKSVEEALKHLLRVADGNPNDPFIWHSIGLQFYSIKAYGDALKYFLRSEHIKAGISAANLFYIGDCMRRSGRVDEAIDYYKQAVRVPVRNQIDRKGASESRRMLAMQGFSEADLDRLSRAPAPSAPQKVVV
uniref:TPR_REGION domain-containing protein n=1 Tax=Panagrellus redivivus TaxID=6233 RepID=A0A7E4ZYI2_PANRE